MKNKIIVGVVSFAVSVANTHLGGVDDMLSGLLFLMVLDYIFGLVTAHMGKSKKSENGGINSYIGWKGIVKKVATLCMIAVGFWLDTMLGVSYIRNAVVIAFCSNELISLVENYGLMGGYVPDVIVKSIDILKGKSDES